MAPALQGFLPVTGLWWVLPIALASVLPYYWPASESRFFSPFPYFTVISLVSSQEEQLGQVAGGLPARKQPLPLSLVFKKPLPCCLVPGLSIPFPLHAHQQWFSVFEQCCGHLPTPPTFTAGRQGTDPAHPQDPLGFGMSGDKFGVFFGRSREGSNGHHQIGTLWHHSAAGSWLLPVS